MSSIPCRFGLKCHTTGCRFEHPAGFLVTATPTTKSQTPCRTYEATGKCSFGAKCRFQHRAPVVGTSAGAGAGAGAGVSVGHASSTLDEDELEWCENDDEEEFSSLVTKQEPWSNSIVRECALDCMSTMFDIDTAAEDIMTYYSDAHELHTLVSSDTFFSCVMSHWDC
jgi:hypothetical protein